MNTVPDSSAAGRNHHPSRLDSGSVNVRPFEWLFLWLQERPVFKATAQLCTFGHPMIFWLGDPLPTMPLHVDVKLEVFKRRGGKVSIYELVHAEAKAQELEALGTFSAIELEGGAPPATASIILVPKEGELAAAAGDSVVMSFRATHRSNPLRVSAMIEAKS